MLPTQVETPEGLTELRRQADELATSWRQGAREAAEHADGMDQVQARHDQLARGLEDLQQDVTQSDKWQSNTKDEVAHSLRAAVDQARVVRRASAESVAHSRSLAEVYIRCAQILENALDSELFEFIQIQEKAVADARDDASRGIERARGDLEYTFGAEGSPWTGSDGVVHTAGIVSP